MQETLMEHRKVAVVAVGGNSLISDPLHQTIPDQYQAAAESMKHIADMILKGWKVVITHGNGPQVGFILRRSEVAAHELHTVPLDYCGADTQGAIGYMFQRALFNEFRERGISHRAVTLVTQVVVDRNDPAFSEPSKPIGSFMEESQAKSHRDADGWAVVEDAGRGWRRVVPSPLPVEIIEADAIQTLVHGGFTVIAVGGGGIPVTRDTKGNLVGIEAVIDKDFASALLAEVLAADLFLISTAVEKVALNLGRPGQQWLDHMSLREAQKYLDDGQFAKGSMEPKIRAVINFLERGGKQALITNPGNIASALEGKTGTRITP
jgi:carbamate kinase